MDNELDLTTIDKELERLATENAEATVKEAELNSKIAELRSQIELLRGARNETAKKIRDAKKNRESVERKIALQREAEAIQKSIDEKKEQALKLIENAPWKDSAFDWQIEGAISLPERAILADRRGMGKSFSAIIWRRVQESKRTLLCLRKEVASDFIKELGIREPKLFVYNLVAATPEQRMIAAELLKHANDYVVVTNIESWRRNVDATTETLLKLPYDAVILDEAHHIKNSQTGTAQGFFKLARKIPKVLELTGTPIKNRPQEMFSILHALYPDIFPRENKFLADFCTMIAPNKYIFTEYGLRSLVAKISPFYLARGPEDVGRKVPPPNIITYELDFESHPQQKKAYQDMSERSLAILGTGKVVPIVSQLAVMTRQAQIVSWPSGIVFEIKDEGGNVIDTVRFDVEQSVKVDWAEDLIKELVDEGERVLLFSRFKPALRELERRLSKVLPVAVITGDSKINRSEVFDDFDLKTASATNHKYKALLATYQTVGESANLNAARHMILLDRFWNPGNEDQAIGRIDRINSVDQATVHIPHVKTSFDDYMSMLIEDKRQLVGGFKDAAAMQASLVEHLKKTV